jgi:hypothetical protein
MMHQFLRKVNRAPLPALLNGDVTGLYGDRCGLGF